MFSFLISSGKCQNNLQLLADPGDWEGRISETIFGLLSHARNILILGVPELPQGTSSAFYLGGTKQDQVTLSLATFYKFPGLRCCHKAISPCSIEQKHLASDLCTFVLFNLYTLCRSKYEFSSQHLDARNVTVLKLALSPPSPRE